MRPTPRLVFAAIFAACVALLAFASYLQHEKGLEPCPLCILQRYAFFAIAAVALAAAIHGPQGVALKVYGVLAALFALAGAGTAIRHSYLQHFPPKTSSCIGTDLEFIVNNFPLSQALPKIFAGTGDCSTVDWSLVGLSIPEWGLVWYLILGVTAVWIAFLRK